MLPIKVTPAAAAHIQEGADWWLANREKAPESFKEELQRRFALISQQPESGAKATNAKLKDVRRIHLSRIRYFLVLPRQREPRRGSRFVALKSAMNPSSRARRGLSPGRWAADL